MEHSFRRAGRRDRIETITLGAGPSRRRGLFPAERQRQMKHLQVERRLKEIITAQRLQPGTQLPDELNMAERMGVGRVTVRRALASLADAGLLSREKGRGTFVARMPDEYEDLNRPFYCTVESNDPLVFPNLHHVSILVPFTYEAYVTGPSGYILFEVINGLRDELAAHGLALNVVTLGKDASLEAFFHLALRAQKLQGLIYHDTTDHSEAAFAHVALAHLGRRLPWAILSKRLLPRNPKCSIVCCDDEPGGRLLADHLVRLGHRRIACLYWKADQTRAGSRTNGWLTGMREAGLAVEERLMVTPASGGQRSGYDAMRQILALPRTEWPTAVCCLSDPWAIGALTAIREMNLRTPGEMAVAGFDDMPLARHTEPPLTTVKKHRYRLGQEAARLILAQAERKSAAPGYVVLQPDLVVRESTVAGGWQAEK
jgi:GntR family transcriptional regulator, arabinose operon transcriptional repressor